MPSITKKYVLKTPMISQEPSMDETRQIFSVSDLTRNIRFTLEENFSNIWVEGEISNFKFHTSGHMYFALKDEASQIQCVMFRTENKRVDFEIGDGMKALCFGRVSVYPIRGQYQIYIERIEPKGAGVLALRFEALKKKLLAMGLFDEAHKKPIPYLPKTIGIVTSSDGAALRDILHVLDRRFKDVHVLIHPAQVQGVGAAESIAQAIQNLNEHGQADVLIVGRGGGSLEDLWAFNEEIVAQAIFDSQIPIISAVGHEVDFTIADFVADLRAATPSAAAEIVLPPKDELVLRIDELKLRASQVFLNKIKTLRENVKYLAQSAVLKNPLAIFEVQFQKLDELSRSLKSFFENYFALKKERIYSLIGKLEALGPAAILKRGFSVTTESSSGRVITTITSLKIGDLVQTKLHNGSFISQIKNLK